MSTKLSVLAVSMQAAAEMTSVRHDRFWHAGEKPVKERKAAWCMTFLASGPDWLAPSVRKYTKRYRNCFALHHTYMLSRMQ